jgi:hypothetical protein
MLARRTPKPEFLFIGDSALASLTNRRTSSLNALRPSEDALGVCPPQAAAFLQTIGVKMIVT